MKTITLLASVLAVVVALPQEHYLPKYDGFNIKEVLDNKNLLNNYGKCFLDMGPCTQEGKDVKKVIPEAIQTYCAKCSPNQRAMIRDVIKTYQTKLPEVWDSMLKKHDPTGANAGKLNEFLNASD